MFCSNCGKEVGGKALFCSNCGIKLTHVEENEENELDQEFVSKSISEEIGMDTENNKETKKKQVSVFKTMLLLICIAMAVTGISYGKRILLEKELERERQERVQRIQNTLRELGDRSCGTGGGPHGLTVRYSMSLSNFSSAALGKEMVSGDKGLNAEEIKEKRFESLETYFESDYLGGYAALMFGADYFDKGDVEYFYDGTKINSKELKACMEEILFKDYIDLSTLLINELDEQICYTMSLRIRLAQDGYIRKKDIVRELYQFVCEGKPLNTVWESLLEEEITYEQIVADREISFSNSAYLYEELSAVGKLVFLYLMPRYIEQFDQEAGYELWNSYFEAQYEKCWKEIIERDMFSEIIQQ